MTSTFSFSISIILTDNKWLDSPWGWYLRISATLAFTKFEIFKHWQFFQCLFWNVLEPPYLILQSFNFTVFRRYLPGNSQFFTPWFVHWYVNKRPFQWFSCLSESTCHVNVEIDNLDLLKYFNMFSFYHLIGECRYKQRTLPIFFTVILI